MYISSIGADTHHVSSSSRVNQVEFRRKLRVTTPILTFSGIKNIIDIFVKFFFSFRSYFFCCCLLTGCWDYEQTRQNWICIIFHLELLASLIISLLHIYEMKTHCPFLDVYRYLYKIWDFGLFRLRIFLPSHFPTSLLKFPFFFHSAIFFSHIESAFFYFFHLFILLGIICGNRS